LEKQKVPTPRGGAWYPQLIKRIMERSAGAAMSGMAIMQQDVANRLVRKLGLKQTPGNDVMKEFAKRTRAPWPTS
jgi:hypothetical protein